MTDEVLIDTYWNVKTGCRRVQVPERAGFNRYILECKERHRKGCKGRAERVLIDTYWNVKKKEIAEESGVPLVLIDTYWNVKLYIVSGDYPDIPVLIDTYWNVKQYTMSHKFPLNGF